MSKRSGQHGRRRARKNPSPLALRLKLKSLLRQGLRPLIAALNPEGIPVRFDVEKDGDMPARIGTKDWEINGRPVTAQEMARFLENEAPGTRFDLAFTLPDGRRGRTVAYVSEKKNVSMRKHGD